MKKIDLKKKTFEKQSTKERSCSDGCHYTTLIGKDHRIYVNFEHHGLQHTTWKESIEDRKSSIKSESLVEQSSWIDLKKQSSLNDRYLVRQELHRYFRSRLPRDHLFQLDTSPYPNRPVATSRRPRDALHIDFYQNDQLKGSKTEATFKTFFHRKYLVKATLISTFYSSLI